MKSKARTFADHICAVLGAQDAIRVLPATRAGLPPVCCFIFRDQPQSDLMTAVTYGLSLSDHGEWGTEKPELIACVRSCDEEWGLAIAGFAERLRGEHSFASGSILMSPSPFSAESEISGFLLGDQQVIPPGAESIALATRSVRLREAYPIYECEAGFIGDIGPTAFLSRPGVDFRDVQREHLWK